jgi:phosphoserine phosphatase
MPRTWPAVSGAIVEAGLNIDRIDRLSGRTPLECGSSGRVCVELAASGPLADEDRLRATLLGLTRAFDIDVR